MTNKEFQKQISALAQEQLALAAVVNQLSMLLSNSEAMLEVAPNLESRGDSISSLEDFVRHSRNYKNYATTAGRWIFDFLTSQATLDSLKAATGEGLPAVAGIAECVIHESICGGKELTELDRQFIGAVVRFRLEANGYRKTGKRGLIPHKPFTQGQVYQPIEN